MSLLSVLKWKSVLRGNDFEQCADEFRFNAPCVHKQYSDVEF